MDSKMTKLLYLKAWFLPFMLHTLPLTHVSAQSGTEELASIFSNLTSALQYSIALSILSDSTTTAALNLDDGEPKTFFVPNDTAFIDFTSKSGELFANATILVEILSYHLVPRYLPAATILSTLADNENTTSLTTLEGSQVNISQIANGTVYINDAAVLATDVLASGLTALHGINKVLVPLSYSSSETGSPPAQPPTSSPTEVEKVLNALDNDGNFTDILNYLINPAFVEALTLNDSTLKTFFVPTDSAFTSFTSAVSPDVITNDTLLTQILSYHIVNLLYYPSDSIADYFADGVSTIITVDTIEGSEVNITRDTVDGEFVYFVNGATISTFDILADNSTAIHAIDTVLVPPSLISLIGDVAPAPSQTPPAQSAPPPSAVNGSEEFTIVSLNLSNAAFNYSQFLAIIPDYVAILNLTDGEEKTIFVPNNNAFAALPASFLSLLTANSSLLRQLLAYHIVPAYLPAQAAITALAVTENFLPLTTLLPGVLLNATYFPGNSSLAVNRAAVVEPDIVASNVTAVHGIGGVLIPPSLAELADAPAPAPAPTPAPPPRQATASPPPVATSASPPQSAAVPVLPPPPTNSSSPRSPPPSMPTTLLPPPTGSALTSPPPPSSAGRKPIVSGVSMLAIAMAAAVLL